MQEWKAENENRASNEYFSMNNRILKALFLITTHYFLIKNKKFGAKLM